MGKHNFVGKSKAVIFIRLSFQEMSVSGMRQYFVPISALVYRGGSQLKWIAYETIDSFNTISACSSSERNLIKHEANSKIEREKKR